MEIPTDEQYIKEGRRVLQKIKKRIEVLIKERETLAIELEKFICGRKSLVKLCPFCGEAINPFIDKSSRYYLIGIRTFKCRKCGRVFSIILRRKK